MPMNVIVIEDDPSIRQLLQINFEIEGVSGHYFDRSPDSFQEFVSLGSGVVILDLNMPGRSGDQVVPILRDQLKGWPILVLTAVADQATKLQLFRLGVDDYLTKPFDLEELLARLKALNRRSGAIAREPKPAALDFGQIVIDEVSGEVQGSAVTLSSRELRVLKQLVAKEGDVVSREDLIAAAWPEGGELANSRTIDNYVVKFRRLLEADTVAVIQNIRGVGYRFVKDKNKRRQ